MTEEWYLEKLASLRISGNRFDTLSEIHNRLNDGLCLESASTNRLLKSREIYDVLEADCAVEHLNLAIDILSICMSNISLNNADLPTILQRSLQHQNAKVRSLALNAILKELTKQPGAMLPSGILKIITDCVQEPPASVGLPAVKILSTNLADHLNIFEVQEALLCFLKDGDIVRCRVYEIAVTLAKLSPDYLIKIEEILDVAILELEHNDVLLQANILEILVPLAEQNHGLVFLEQKQVLEKLSKRIEYVEDYPLDKLLVPGIIKFFGKIAYSHPEKIIKIYPNLVQCLFDCLHSADLSLLPIALDTFANLAHSRQGKILLEAYHSEMLGQAFKDLLLNLNGLPTEFKNRTFNALELIFACEGDNSYEVNKITEKWCQSLTGGQNIQFLLDFCRNPFPDIKVSCLNFTHSICGYKWGVLSLKNTAGFVEYLLDRRIEFDKTAKIAKFRIIQILSESDVFDLPTHLQLKTYVNEGPFYVQSVVEVAVYGS